MLGFTLLHARTDGSFVIRRGGLPYHVTQTDALYGAVAAAAEGMTLAPEPVPEPVPEPAPTMIGKTTIYRRATDAEIAAIEGWLSTEATTRQRLMWRDAEGGMVMLADVQPLAEALFGAERAAELLAPV